MPPAAPKPASEPAATRSPDRPPRRIGLIVNPTAGKGAGRKIGAEVLAGLRAAGHDVIDLSGHSAREAAHHARDALERIDLLAVCGGDGTANLGVNLTAQTGTPLAVIPAGTGNDIASALGIPANRPDAAVTMISHGATRMLDAGRCTSGTRTKWFGGVLGAGFDAKVVDRANSMSWPAGQMRYNLAILRELPVFRPIPYAVTIDGARIDTHAMLVAVANAPSFGGGMRVCPDARLDDGLFDVMICHRISIGAFLRVFPRVFTGRHVDHPAVEIRRGREITLTASGLVSQADGESFLPLPLEVDAVPGAVRMVVPPAPS